MLAVTERCEWEEWLNYFLCGVEGQADDALKRIQVIDMLLIGWRKKLDEKPSLLAERALGLFVENPFWTVSKLALRLEVAFTTAQRAIDRLEGAGIVERTTEAKRNRAYGAHAILRVFEQPFRGGTNRRQ
ncbi:MAG: hypothetical protein EXS14_02315 [Planctomycetes bacterium]|nr:hypothetical protein [Planctomycetota bacterium]